MTVYTDSDFYRIKKIISGKTGFINQTELEWILIKVSVVP